MTIKHLVISGGGPIMIQIMSAIQELERREILNMGNIESIYGTSAGAIIGLMISLKFDWDTLNDYIIKRPWHDVFPIKVQNILDAYTKKGIFDIKTVEKCFKPLFDTKDIPLDINMEDFYKLTKIELHMFSFEVNEYKVIDISYKTHPKLKLLQAVQMTSALPILVTPVFIDDKCFIDGGVGCNYPLNFCIDSGKEPDEILGFKNKCSDEGSYINTESTLLDFMLSFLCKAIFNIHNNYIQPIIKNEVICDTSFLTFNVLKSTLSNIDIRRELFEKGKQAANKFLETIKLDLDTLQDSV
jgi:predicted acylesterase/phospholipase RssA